MQVNEALIQKMLEGTQQYVVPLFQRQYSWKRDKWNTLWDDVLAQVSDGQVLAREGAPAHFMGSVVCAQASSNPAGVAKYLLIDGQQRSTTLMILLAALRDAAKASPEAALQTRAQKINETILTNNYEDGLDRYKLLPTQPDRAAYRAIIDGPAPVPGAAHLMDQAYLFFAKKLRGSHHSILTLADTVLQRLSVVLITLGQNDNPYAVFESLNAKGEPLSQADLIRNLIFMRIHQDDQERVYHRLWLPLQERIGEGALTEFIRHYLSQDGATVRTEEVFVFFKNQLSYEPLKVEILVSKMLAASARYATFLKPALEENVANRRLLDWIRRFEITTAYPLVLHLDRRLRAAELTEAEFWQIVGMVFNYTVRRFAASIPTSGIRDTFARVILGYATIEPGKMVAYTARVLAENRYPSDTTFSNGLATIRLYEGGNKAKTKVILEMLEDGYGHREAAPTTDASIEHIMPQTLTQAWREALGPDYQQVHDLYLHTLGNLTLTGYNPQLSNKSFTEKRAEFAQSHYEMTRELSGYDTWDKAAIEDRAYKTTQAALKIWPHLAPDLPDAVTHIQTRGTDNVRGTVPTLLRIGGLSYQVASWRDVIRTTLETIVTEEPGQIDKLADALPSYLKKDPSTIRNVYAVPNTSYYMELNLSAEYMMRFCQQAVQILDLTDGFEVEYA